MPRDQGFAVADTDTGLHNDPKIKLLWRLVRRPAAMNAAMTLYESVRLASWDAGDRVSAGDAAPFWMTDVSAAQMALTEAGLLDDEGFIPVHAWEGWFGPANERREQRREAGRLGGQRSRRSDAEPSPERRSSAASPTLNPSVPSVPSYPSAPSVPSPAAAVVKHGSKNLETDEERMARYLALRDDPSKSADIRYAAENEVKRLEALRLN
jgi:hypothetical protein